MPLEEALTRAEELLYVQRTECSFIKTEWILKPVNKGIHKIVL